MENNYYIDTGLSVIFEKYNGQVAMKDIIDLTKKVVTDTSFFKGLNVYVDVSNAMPDFSVDINSIKESMSFFRSVEDHFDGCKWAVFAPQDYAYTFTRIFVKLFNSKKVEVEVFKDEPAAKKWLGL